MHNSSKLAKRSAFFVLSYLAAACAALPSCNAADSSTAAAPAASATTAAGPVSIPIGSRKFTTDVMLYDGDGSWAAEVTNLENILDSNKISYQEVASDDLNSMSLAELTDFGAIVWVGGEAGTQADSLTTDAKHNLRAAVQQNGVSWLGFCAGSFIAVEPAATVDSNPEYGLSIVDAPLLQLYYLEDQDEQDGVADYNLTLESFPDGSTHDILWYGGPVTLDGQHTVVAKYPNGQPAISQVWSGNGLVLLSGVHPTASDYTLQSLLGSEPPDGNDQALALRLVQAAISQQALPTF